jgi:hypothetical protein
VRTGGQTTAQGYFQLHIPHQQSVLAYRLLRALKTNENSEKDFFFHGENLMTEVENIFWDTQVSPYAFYEEGP